MTRPHPPWMTPQLEAQIARVKADPIWEANAWATTFLCGFDIFNSTGLSGKFTTWEVYLTNLRREAKGAWSRVGRTYLDRLFQPEDPDWKCWAQVEFGDPPRP